MVAASGDTVVQTMLSSPDLAAADKASKLAELCADEINDEASPFLQALAEHDRLMLLEECVISLKRCAQSKSDAGC